MKFESACRIAMDYFKKEYDDVGLCSIQDLGEKWLFGGADAELSVIYGKPGVTIDKKQVNLNFSICRMQKTSNYLIVLWTLIFQRNTESIKYQYVKNIPIWGVFLWACIRQLRYVGLAAGTQL